MNHLKQFGVRALGTFETRQRDVEVRLEIVATLQFSSLEHLAQLLTVRPDIDAAIADAIDAVVRERIYSMDPEVFYTRFSLPDEHDTQSAEAELSQLVTDRLSGDPYNARVVNIVLKLVETDLMRRFRELQEAITSFAVTVEPTGAEPMKFQGDLRVVAVHPDGWRTFQGLTEGIERITARICEQLPDFLHTRPVGELLYSTEAGRDALQASVSAMVARYAGDQFGLVVRVSSFRRASVASAELYGDFREGRALRVAERVTPFGISGVIDLDDERGVLARTILHLVQRRSELVDVDTDADELRAVEWEIAALQRRLRQVGGQGAEEASAAVVNPSGEAETVSSDVSAFDIALLMDLEGPPDWSERIDYYLYGVDDGE